MLARIPSAARFDNVAVAMHWLVALLAIAVVVLGWLIPEAPRGSAWREWLLILHRSLGLVILLAMLFRAVWRFNHPPPHLPASLARVEVVVAHLTHFLLYAVFVAMALAGYVNTAAAGHSISLFGIVGIPPLIPEDQRLAQWAFAAHLAGQFAIYALVAMHVAAALLHLLIRRDGVFERMLPARRGG